MSALAPVVRGRPRLAPLLRADRRWPSPSSRGGLAFLVRLMLKGKPAARWDHVPARVALASSCTSSARRGCSRGDFWPGLMHATIFWGFVVLTLGTIEFFGKGVDGVVLPPAPVRHARLPDPSGRSSAWRVIAAIGVRDVPPARDQAAAPHAVHRGAGDPAPDPRPHGDGPGRRRRPDHRWPRPRATTGSSPAARSRRCLARAPHGRGAGALPRSPGGCTPCSSWASWCCCRTRSTCTSWPRRSTCSSRRSTPKGQFPHRGPRERRDLRGRRHRRSSPGRISSTLYNCTECGRCTSRCPANMSGKELDPKWLILNLREHLQEGGQALLGQGRERRARGAARRAHGGRRHQGQRALGLHDLPLVRGRVPGVHRARAEDRGHAALARADGVALPGGAAARRSATSRPTATRGRCRGRRGPTGRRTWASRS